MTDANAKLVDYLNKVGFSGKPCEICKKETTNPAFFYSMKTFGKNLCKGCQYGEPMLEDISNSFKPKD